LNRDAVFALVDQKMPSLAAEIFKSVTTIGFDRAWDIPDDRVKATIKACEDALPNPCTVPVYLQIHKLLKTQDRQKAKNAQANSYDGVFYFGEDTVRDEPEWIVFRPEQIKSAIGNNGLYLKGSASLTDVNALDLQAHQRPCKKVAIAQAQRALDLAQAVAKEKFRAQAPVA
jgi:hypothetical protein